MSVIWRIHVLSGTARSGNVYIQALFWQAPGQCGGPNHVVHAKGPSLYNLSWDMIPGTTQARAILSGAGGAGIGEDMQWFYAPMAPNPFVVTYNDWGLSGATMRAGYSWDGVSTTQWYTSVPANEYANLPAQGYTGAFVFPDVLLPGSIDEGIFGPPAIGAQSSCSTVDASAYQYQYSRVIGYYPSPVGNGQKNGQIVGGALRSIGYDYRGERMFRPRFGRDSRGFVPLTYSAPNLKQWSTYVVYNPAQINNNGNDGCDRYQRWNTSDQSFAISQVYVYEW